MAKRKSESEPLTVNDPGPVPDYFDEWELKDEGVRTRPRRPKGEFEPKKKERRRRRVVVEGEHF